MVTGASRGLGAAIAKALAADGWSVAVNFRADADGATSVVDAIAAAGGTAAAFRGDVTDEDGVRRLVADVTAQLGPVTCVVANAVGNHDPRPLHESTWDEHLRQLDYGLKSPLLLTQATADGMKEAGGGRVIVIGSDILERASPGNGAYAAAKGAQLGAARVWAKELGPHGITVNVVAPGWVPVERHAGVAAAELDAYAATVPLRRMGTPADVAATVVFLASDGGAFLTAQRLVVNGGSTPG
ncbi:MAG: short-chain dehydrogenase/reductase [Frankiales bacterium]|nr:short-chain dehydrogenase/reductase [Frankiales bacterium]